MNKIYILIPMIGLLIFGGFYLNFDKGYEAKLEAIRAKAVQELKDKQARDQVAREQAYKAAIDAAAKRKAEREEKERVEEAKKKARLEAEDRRQHTFEERKRFREQAERLRKDVETVKADIAKLEEDKKHSNDELTFLKEYVRKAEANQKAYYDLYAKIEAADAAKAEAEKLAKAANKG
jgi:colicin import membrane protein